VLKKEIWLEAPPKNIHIRVTTCKNAKKEVWQRRKTKHYQFLHNHAEVVSMKYLVICPFMQHLVKI